MRRNERLHSHNPGRPLAALVEAYKREDALEVGSECFSNLGVIFAAVVGLIRKRDSTLLKKNHILFRVSRVSVNKELPQTSDAFSLQAAQRGRKVVVA